MQEEANRQSRKLLQYDWDWQKVNCWPNEAEVFDQMLERAEVLEAAAKNSK